jgi:hypothetical protein
MGMTNVVDQARELKAQAMDARDEGRFKRSHRLLDKAVQLLRDALAEIATSGAGVAGKGEYELKVRTQLLHIYGSIGGVYRREKRYEESARAYDDGDKTERTLDHTSQPNSYNLTQRLIARALIDARAIETEGVLVEGEPVRELLIAARRDIERQQTVRLGDAYATADLLLVSILLGDSDWTEAAANLRSQAKNDQYALDVTRDVLALLREKAVEFQLPGLAERLRQAIAGLR